MITSKAWASFGIIFFSTLFFYFSHSAYAHPVIYKEGTVLSSESNKDKSEFHAAYSFHQAWAVGFHMIMEPTRELDFLQVAHLIKRWNKEDSQANVYAILGAGAAREFGVLDVKWSSAQMIDIMADWENRDYYVQGMQRYIHLPDDQKEWHSKMRLGLAPFRSDALDLGIWGILQFDKMNGDDWVTTHLLRFYYKTALWEIGANLKGSYQINLMFHL